MSEIRKDVTVLSWEEGHSKLNAKSINDFDSRGDYYKPVKGAKFTAKNVGVRVLQTDKEKGFPVVECYGSKNEFLGYMSFKRLQGRKFLNLEIGKQSGKKYAKFDITNDFCKSDTITLGFDSMKKLFNDGKKLECTDVHPQKVPSFDADLESDNYPMVDDNYFSLIIK